MDLADVESVIVEQINEQQANLIATHCKALKKLKIEWIKEEDG